VTSVSTSSFTVALQEQENGNSHASEEIAWVAIEKGEVADAGLPFYLEVGSVSGVTDADTTINFTTAFPGPPAFLAAMQTINGPNSAALRTKSVASAAATLFVEEEQSCDSELSHPGAEEVGYVSVLNGAGTLNIAVVTSALQEGILQKVKDKVRLGVSFYRYDPDISDIYNGNTINGGTLKFKIPLNPFVKKPTDASLASLQPPQPEGYRELTGYIGTPIEEIIDGIEHYPLVWGTTPIAEDLWEVIQYFEQDTPYYSAVTSGFEDFDLADASHPERDPYYHPTYGEKMECIKSNVLIFTDGFPFKDADIPSTLLDYDGDGKTASNCNDSSTKNTDCASSDPNAWGHDNLDDVGYWAYCDTSQGSCIDAGTGKAVTPSRDLRTDIINDQFLRIDAVGFAGGTIRPILQDTADNAGGTAYAAADGLALADALGTVFAKITGSSAAAVAVNSGSIQSNSKLFLARFNSNDWSGKLLAFKINPDGTLAHSVDANGLIIPDAAGWQASLPAADTRVILTHDGTVGRPFRWTNQSDPQATLSATQKTLLDAANAGNSSSPVLDWLRGDQSNEESNGGVYRDRNTLLGDIVHSSPVFVGAPVAFNCLLLGGYKPPASAGSFQHELLS
jgi:type IV pilus assembly protein PilY1